MFSLVKKKGIVYLIIAAFLSTIAFTPAPSYASWDDKSDELPGMADDSVMTILLISGIVLVGYLVYLVYAKNKEKENTKKTDNKTEAKPDSSTAAFNYELEKIDADSIPLDGLQINP